MDGLTLTLGESAEAPATVAELEERAKLLEERTRRDAKEILDLLRRDLPAFVQRSVKERFLGAPAFAASLGNAQLAALKADAQKTGEQAAAEIIPTLEDGALWLEVGGPVPSPTERHDLRGHAEISKRLQRVGGFVKDLLARHGFPGLTETEFSDAYRLPKWFIAGKYATALVESYWRDLDELLTTRAALRAMQDRDQKQKLASRWDAA